MEKIETRDLYRIISELPKEGPFVFDCDGTLITHDMASHMCWELLRTGQVQHKYLPPEWKEYEDMEFSYNMFLDLRTKIGHRLEIEEIFRWEFHAMTGMAEEKLIAASREVFIRELHDGVIALVKPTTDVIKNNSDRCFIVSGSPFHCVLPVGETLGVLRKNIYASQMKVDAKRILLPEIEPPGVIWGEAKRLILEENKVPRPVLAAGDSSGDLPLLDWASHLAWCVISPSELSRLYSFESHIKHFILNDNEIPKENGLYLVEKGLKKWILQVENQS